MCGIFGIICEVESLHCLAQEYNNHIERLKRRGPDISGTLELNIDDKHRGFFAGHVLWTQGNRPVRQPLLSYRGSMLLWNGDAYSGIDLNDSSDTETVLELFTTRGVRDTLAGLCGPYSFIFWDGDKLWFGRDPIGRHSLIMCKDSSKFVLSSVSSLDLPSFEVPANGIYVADFSSGCNLTLFPWKHLLVTDESLGPLVPILDEPVSHQVFGEGQLKQFGAPTDNDLQFIQDFVGIELNLTAAYDHLINRSIWSNLLSEFEKLLKESVELRVTKMPLFCKDCIKGDVCLHSKLAILFSGGVDCTLLAFYADFFVPVGESIDLLNVSFDRQKNGNFLVPDRQTGLDSLQELVALRPKRKWNFVEINVSMDELRNEMANRISTVIYPLSTVLDEDLGGALWFASSGKGMCRGESYTSPARVVLLGMGADELTGGYRKARKAWNGENRWEKLAKELDYAVRELPRRNLGRDNRIVSDHSLSPRFPYLHDPLVAFFQYLPSWHRCYMGWPEGLGDKLIIRLLAWKCGLVNAASLKKRAIQFGSRIADPKRMAHESAAYLIRNE